MKKYAPILCHLKFVSRYVNIENKDPHIDMPCIYIDIACTSNESQFFIEMLY